MLVVTRPDCFYKKSIVAQLLHFLRICERSHEAVSLWCTCNEASRNRGILCNNRHFFIEQSAKSGFEFIQRRLKIADFSSSWIPVIALRYDERRAGLSIRSYRNQSR